MCCQRLHQEDKPGYQAYLLRLWRVSNKKKPEWRASLESTQSGELLVFTELGELFAFLESQTKEINIGK
jgi:hypothetical protein